MEITYLDHMGSDLTPVNAARVSFKKTRKDGPLTDKDVSLINYLARGCTSGEWTDLIREASGSGRDDLSDLMRHVSRMPPHWTPFGHAQVSLHMKVPLFVAAQLKRHTVGFVVNEVSRRYIDEPPEFFLPEEWRKRARSVKQGSDGLVGSQPLASMAASEAINVSARVYAELLEMGAAPEQARLVLPQALYTEFWMTGSLYGWANLYVQRADPHAQIEIQHVAQEIQEIIEPLFPVSWTALTS